MLRHKKPPTLLTFDVHNPVYNMLSPCNPFINCYSKMLNTVCIMDSFLMNCILINDWIIHTVICLFLL